METSSQCCAAAGDFTFLTPRLRCESWRSCWLGAALMGPQSIHARDSTGSRGHRHRAHARCLGIDGGGRHQAKSFCSHTARRRRFHRAPTQRSDRQRRIRTRGVHATTTDNRSSGAEVDDRRARAGHHRRARHGPSATPSVCRSIDCASRMQRARSSSCLPTATRTAETSRRHRRQTLPSALKRQGLYDPDGAVRKDDCAAGPGPLRASHLRPRKLPDQSRSS